MAAYAICVRDGQILLARSPAQDGTPEWVLPGGGMEHGEDPYDTVRREVEEETGYRIEVTGLLGVNSAHRVFRNGFGPPSTTTASGSSTRPGSSAANSATR